MIVDPLFVSAVVVLGVLGLAIGSFLNVVVYRVPLGLSVVRPASGCPTCGHAIRVGDNIPVLSWIMLRGRCRDCSSSISRRYPLVEMLTGALFVIVALHFVSDSPAALPAYLFFASIGVALVLIDLDVHRLPNAIVVPAYPVTVVLLSVASFVTGEWDALLRAAIGGASLFAFYFVLAFAVPGGMGFGDVKLAGVVGLLLAWLGWGPLVVGAFSAFLLGGLFSIALVIGRRAGRKSGIPFGPWMLAGAALGIFFGDVVAERYLSIVGLS